jgi:uncharacterized membrane protein (DUF2068 family)
MSNQSRYLKVIALWKLAKGAMLMAFGLSLLFLDIRQDWYVAVIEWIDAELMLPARTLASSPLFAALLRRLEEFLINTNLKTTGILALVYATVLGVEGVGVYREKRWAEWLMVLATASLIPIEVYHLFHKFTWFKIGVIIVNCFIVWYLYRTLQSTRMHKKNA